MEATILIEFCLTDDLVADKRVEEDFDNVRSGLNMDERGEGEGRSGRG